jgi:hypothetical protein
VVKRLDRRGAATASSARLWSTARAAIAVGLRTFPRHDSAEHAFVDQRRFVERRAVAATLAAQYNAPLFLTGDGRSVEGMSSARSGRSTSAMEGLIVGGGAALDASPEQQLRALLP